MQTQKEWNKPELVSFGSVEAITEQNINVTKSVGSGDFIVLNINNAPVTIPDPGNGPATNISVV